MNKVLNDTDRLKEIIALKDNMVNEARLENAGQLSKARSEWESERTLAHSREETLKHQVFELEKALHEAENVAMNKYEGQLRRRESELDRANEKIREISNEKTGAECLLSEVKQTSLVQVSAIICNYYRIPSHFYFVFFIEKVI